MHTIYLVISKEGSYEDSIEIPMRAFVSKSKAESFKKVLEEDIKRDREWAERCKECGGITNGCPLYMDSFDRSIGCNNYFPYYDDVLYKIIELTLED